MLGTFADLLQTVPDLWLGFMLHGDVGKADDRIHGGPDVMGHIVQEGGLGPARILRGMDRILQPLIDLLVLCAVRQTILIVSAVFIVSILSYAPH